jgi:hypothetical protein
MTVCVFIPSPVREGTSFMGFLGLHMVGVRGQGSGVRGQGKWQLITLRKEFSAFRPPSCSSVTILTTAIFSMTERLDQKSLVNGLLRQCADIKIP